MWTYTPLSFRLALRVHVKNSIEHFVTLLKQVKTKQKKLYKKSQSFNKWCRICKKKLAKKADKLCKFMQNYTWCINFLVQFREFKMRQALLPLFHNGITFSIAPMYIFLNVLWSKTDLNWFLNIVPLGLPSSWVGDSSGVGAGPATSLSQQSGKKPKKTLGVPS